MAVHCSFVVVAGLSWIASRHISEAGKLCIVVVHHDAGKRPLHPVRIMIQIEPNDVEIVPVQQQPGKLRSAQPYD